MAIEGSSWKFLDTVVTGDIWRTPRRFRVVCCAEELSIIWLFAVPSEMTYESLEAIVSSG